MECVEQCEGLEQAFIVGLVPSRGIVAGQATDMKELKWWGSVAEASEGSHSHCGCEMVDSVLPLHPLSSCPSHMWMSWTITPSCCAGIA